jgi:vitamin B12 transporter
LTGDIERIEVLRGPQSGLYGSDAIGGVISITTKQGSGPPRVTASVEGGSFGTTNERLGLSGSQGDFNYVFNVQHFQSASTPVTPSYDLAPGEQRNDDFYDNLTVSDETRRQTKRHMGRQCGGSLDQLDASLHRR